MFTIVSIFLTAAILVAIFIPNLRKEVMETSRNYLEDLSVAYGSRLEDAIQLEGKDQAMSRDNLSRMLKGVGLEGMDSSYLYLVSPDSTMLYHPTAEKIGEPVENAVVKGVASDIQAGKKITNKIVSYDFKGVTKYAAYYVDKGQNFILVVTVDENQIFSNMNRVTLLGIAGAVIVLIILTVLGLIFINRILIRRIYALTEYTGRMADLDFSDSGDISYLEKHHDEIGLIAGSVSKVREEVGSITGVITDIAGSLNDTAASLRKEADDTAGTMNQVEKAVSDIAEGAVSQASETQEANEDVIKMGSMVSDTSSRVNDLMSSASEMKKANEDAQKIISELQTISDQAEKYFKIIEEQTNTTNASAMKINEATKMISDIASQTNLLSLNASIEAARAGEQGRGFAVVASEIQNLAEQSNQSAKKIEEVISELMADSENAVETMQKVNEIMTQQMTYIVNTDKAFDRIQNGVSASIEGMSEIADRTRALDDARVRVVDVVNSLTSIAEENAAATEESSASVQLVTDIVGQISDQATSLSDVSAQLDEKLKQFTI